MNFILSILKWRNTRTTCICLIPPILSNQVHEFKLFRELKHDEINSGERILNGGLLSLKYGMY